MTKMTHYRFEHFDIGIMLGDMRFGRNALKPAQTLSSVDVYTTDYKRIKLHDLVAKKALLIVTGSLTCPMTMSSLPDLKTLQVQFGKDISFTLLYVREAHPGEQYPQPQALDQKISNAKTFAKNHSVSWPVIVDDIDGPLHHLLDTKPNSVHLINSEGSILFQSLWAGDDTAVKRAMAQLSNDVSITTPISQKMMSPFLRGVGFMDEILKLAGPRAYHELFLGAPPIAILSKLSSFYGFLPKHVRGYAVIFILLLIVSIGATGFLYATDRLAIDTWIVTL
jgi:Iodothyronine deiodinase